jgi:RNA polymerase sigma factor (sigma-70 family)
MPHEHLKQLFQLEFAKMVAVISNLFGLQHIELAEDIVSDTFLTAAEDWEKSGIPPNPTAWLYTVAKRKTIHQFRRQKIFDQKVAPALSSIPTNSPDPIDLDFSPKHIRDSQLQMLFAVCTPAIASEAQIGLALRILCGFGIDEIAEAFLSNKETINKRLFRAKEKLRTENIRLGLPPESEISARLDNVLHIIYLLFSEGYYSQTQNRILQKELCWEGMRLGVLLTEYELTNQPKTNALLALMCFHASRFNARQTSEAAVILYEQQDERLWDTDLIRKGLQYLALSATGDQLSSYHLEARIASWHCIKEDTPGKWEEILQLYNQLLSVNYSPSVALNRTFALYKANSRDQALIELEKLKLEGNYFYNVLRDFLRTLPPH